MIGAYCVDDIEIIMWNGEDEWNEPFSGSIIPEKGYVDYKTRLVRDIRGQEVVSSVTVMLRKSIDKKLGRVLRHEDRIRIVGEDFERPIITIGQPKAFSRPHYEVALT